MYKNMEKFWYIIFYQHFCNIYSIFFKYLAVHEEERIEQIKGKYDADWDIQIKGGDVMVKPKIAPKFKYSDLMDWLKLNYSLKDDDKEKKNNVDEEGKIDTKVYQNDVNCKRCLDCAVPGSFQRSYYQASKTNNWCRKAILGHYEQKHPFVSNHYEFSFFFIIFLKCFCNIFLIFFEYSCNIFLIFV